jgi:hypothetical protein
MRTNGGCFCKNCFSYISAVFWRDKLMKKLLALVCVLSWGLGAARAQSVTPNDSITQALNQQLVKGPVPPMVRVVQVRGMLIESLQTDQVRRIPSLIDYLRSTVSDSVPQLQIHETWGLLAASGQFGPLLQHVAADDPFNGRRIRRAPSDNLFDATQSYLARHLDELRERARYSRFPAEDSACLQLVLQLLAERRLPTPEALNLDLQRFAARYPQSNYHYFVATMIRPEYEPSRFRYGLDFHSGTGFFFGDLNKVFRSKFNVGHGFEFGWDRYMLYLRNYIGFAETRVPYTIKGHIWPAGQRIEYFIPEISVGYRVLENRRLLVTPFAGVSWCGFTPNTADAKKNPSIDTDVTMKGLLTAGLNVDVLLWNTHNRMEVGSWLLKIRSGVRNTRGPSVDRGGVIYLDIGVGGFGRLLRRKKKYQINSK